MIWTDKAKKIILKHWNYTELKDKQTEVINEILLGNDVIGLLPTGYGKSMCYILPALLTKKIIFIISPLISLMEDQKTNLLKYNINVVALHSNNKNKEQEIEDIKNGKINIVYMSPEYLIEGYGFDLAKLLIENARLKYLAIDEAHCLSSWGHDFRPNYLKLCEFRKEFPHIPIMAVTATAKTHAVQDIKNNLKLNNNTQIIRAGFDRPNLYLECLEFPFKVVKKTEKGKQTLKNVNDSNKIPTIIKSYINKYPNQKIIVYINVKKETEEVASKIDGCMAYHAGLSDIKRNEIQLKFNSGEINVIISTIAFGMGIDQIVRCVLIFGCSKSVEEYYQQIGRGGRDGKYCETVLYYNYSLYKKLYFMIKKDGNNNNNLSNLNNIEKYYFTKTCRRRFILEYLGFGNDNYFLLHTFTCNNCDNCTKNNLVDYTQDFIENNKKSFNLKQKYNLHIIINNWKNYIISNKLNFKNIPLYNRIRLPEENVVETLDIYDKYEKLI